MSNHLIIDIPKTTYVQGETINGSILWDLSTPPQSLVVSMGWWTEGRGTRDEIVLDHTTWNEPAPIGKESFSFQIPLRAPSTFSGRLISVCWALQLSAKKVKIDDILEPLLISPHGREIDITANSFKSEGKSFSFGSHR